MSQAETEASKEWILPHIAVPSYCSCQNSGEGAPALSSWLAAAITGHSERPLNSGHGQQSVSLAPALLSDCVAEGKGK